MSERSLKDNVVIITGGAAGIGLEVADKFLSKSAKVAIIIDVNESGKDIADKLCTKYGKARAVFIKGDVTNEQTLQDIYNEVLSTYKTVDVLVNSAGVLDEIDHKKCLEVNAGALVNWSIKFFNHMRKDKSGKGGTIVNFSSIYGFRITPYIPVYHATKFAVLGFSKSLGHESNYNLYGVRVVAICPGYTRTGMPMDPKVWTDEPRHSGIVDMVENAIWQDADVVANAAVDVFENADSGTAWLIEENKPIVQV